jgi:hypothetical protein
MEYQNKTKLSLLYQPPFSATRNFEFFLFSAKLVFGLSRCSGHELLMHNLFCPVAIFVYKQCLFISVTWSGEACILFVYRVSFVCSFCVSFVRISQEIIYMCNIYMYVNKCLWQFHLGNTCTAGVKCQLLISF